MLQGGRVVDAVAGHGDDLAVDPEKLGESKFLLGIDAGEDGLALGKPVAEGAVVELAELRTGDHVRLPLDKADPAPNCLGGADAGLAAAADGVADRRAGRVDHAYEPEQFEVALDSVRVDVGVGRQHAAREREHTQSVAFHRGHGARDFGARLGVQGRTGQHHLRRALDIGDMLVADQMHRGHPLTLGAERELEQPRRAGGLLLVTHSALLGEHDQRGLGRIAEDRPAALAVYELRVAAEEPGAKELSEWRWVYDSALGADASERLVPDALNGQLAAERPDALHSHVVLGQRPRLVGTDHGRLAERFDGGAGPRERAPP